MVDNLGMYIAPQSIPGNGAPQVVLYGEPLITGHHQRPAGVCAALTTLSLRQCLQAGMRCTAYFPGNQDSAALHRRMQAAMHGLVQDLSAVVVEFASHCSTVIYITVLRTSIGVTVEHLVEALKRNSREEAAATISVEYGHNCFFELREKGAPLPAHIAAACCCYIWLCTTVMYPMAMSDGSWAFFKVKRPPTLRRVLHVALHLDGGTCH